MCWITKQVSFFENNVLTSVEIGEWWTRVDSKMVLLYTIQADGRTKLAKYYGSMDRFFACQRHVSRMTVAGIGHHINGRSNGLTRIDVANRLSKESEPFWPNPKERRVTHPPAGYHKNLKGRKKKKRDMWYRLYYLIESGYQNWFNI